LSAGGVFARVFAHVAAADERVADVVDVPRHRRGHLLRRRHRGHLRVFVVVVGGGRGERREDNRVREVRQRVPDDDVLPRRASSG